MTPAQAFSWEYCEVFKNSFFIEHPRKAASVNSEDLPLVQYLNL